ncbi:hypothetical protein THAR02_07503 [Trichoderma harzianum]|uniref:Uncharacterized protein n=1 Tax=Trichoderma harzianum TaxID=5544 RepID=A0A0F9XIX7_TRIHA|nr:hypothetical protein THAR02_07503 [Trichoderma harzianum]
MLELIRNCSRARTPVVETRGKPDKADVDFFVALLTSSEQHAVRIEDSKVFARSVALAVAHDKLEAPRPAAPDPCSLPTTKDGHRKRLQTLSSDETGDVFAPDPAYACGAAAWMAMDQSFEAAGAVLVLGAAVTSGVASKAAVNVNNLD